MASNTASFAWMGGKVENVANHCVYEIATGRWPKGHRLPSVREAERLWRVNRLTVLRAYRRLVEMGLVAAASRSGFTVSDNDRLDRITRHRFELEELYDEVARRIRRSSDLSAVGVLRYLAEIAEQRARERPEAAFVECTAIQAEGHVAEIEQRLRVPVLALTLNQIGGRPARIPREVRTLLTSPWHREELTAVTKQRSVRAVSVPIEIAPDLSSALGRRFKDVTILDTSESEAFHLGRDIRGLGLRMTVRAEIVPDVEIALANRLQGRSARSRSAVLLSPRFWGAVAARWRDHPCVFPIRFRICEHAWPEVADSLGLPLGGASVPSAAPRKSRVARTG